MYVCISFEFNNSIACKKNYCERKQSVIYILLRRFYIISSLIDY